MGKYKIVNMKKAPSREEIESHKSYDSIVKAYHSQKRIARLKIILILSTVAVILSAGLWSYFEVDPDQQESTIEKEVPSLSPQPIVNDTLTADTVIVNKQPIPSKEEPNHLKTPADTTSTNYSTSQPKQNLQEYSFKEAYAPYDMDSLLGRLAIQLNHTVKIAYQGSAVLAFKVYINGSIKEVKTIKSTTSEIDSLLIELWSTAPNWLPAELNGKPVSSTITLPIDINIQPIN